MHYISWKNFPKNYLLIKYEDLLKNPVEEIKRIYNYLKKFFELDLQLEDLNKVSELSSFKNLKNKENKDGFDESHEDREDKKKISFFHSGPLNDWKKTLDKDVKIEIERNFSKEMKELGYI